MSFPPSDAVLRLTADAERRLRTRARGSRKARYLARRLHDDGIRPTSFLIPLDHRGDVHELCHYLCAIAPGERRRLLERVRELIREHRSVFSLLQADQRPTEGQDDGTNDHGGR